MSTWITSYLCWGIVSDEAKHSDKTDKLGLKDWRCIIWAKTMLETWAANTNSSKWTINYVMQMHFNILNAVIFSLRWPSPTDPHKSKQWLISRHVRHDELLHSYKTIKFTKNKTKHMVQVALDIMWGCFSHFWWLMSLFPSFFVHVCINWTWTSAIWRHPNASQSSACTEAKKQQKPYFTIMNQYLVIMRKDLLIGTVLPSCWALLSRTTTWLHRVELRSLFSSYRQHLDKSSRHTFRGVTFFQLYFLFGWCDVTFVGNGDV